MNLAGGILIVCSDLECRHTLLNILRDQNADPICAPTIQDALELLGHQTTGLVFCDRDLPDGSYRDFLVALRPLKSRVRVVVTSRQADWDEYLDAMRYGAFDVIAAPCRPTDVEWMMIQSHREQRSQLRALVSAAAPATAYPQSADGRPLNRQPNFSRKIIQPLR
jgi:DNA-binding NtrC family response regulator